MKNPWNKIYYWRRLILIPAAPFVGLIVAWEKEWKFLLREAWNIFRDGLEFGYRTWKVLTAQSFFPEAGYYVEIYEKGGNGPRVWFLKNPPENYKRVI